MTDRLLIFILFLFVCTPRLAEAGILYVKADATGTNAGTSWINAYTDLQLALASAQSSDEIWVAAGTYKPTSGTDRTISFTMKEGVAIYGGFAGTEATRAQRNLASTTTTLSGDIGAAGNLSDNSFHVVAGANNAVLDGFTVTSGNADTSAGLKGQGAGMINEAVSPTVANCTFSNNAVSGLYPFGGAMYNSGASASPTITNCIFSFNSAAIGGGMHNTGSSPTVINCIFRSNISAGGGGMHNESNSPTVTNCSFIGNSGGHSGGGMFNYLSSATITNCTFSSNSTSMEGGGICNNSSSPVMINCTFYANSAKSGGSGFGGGIINRGSSPTVTNCTFSSNSADFGGGIRNWNSSPTVINCTFTGNSASYIRPDPFGDFHGGSGGAMYNTKSNYTVANCTFTSNSAYTSGGGIYNEDGSTTVTNSIFWNDSATTAPEVHLSSGTAILRHCDIQDSGGSGALWNQALGTDGGGNIMADPLFVNAANPAGSDNTPRTGDDGLRLLPLSPCIDAGLATGAPATDILGQLRSDIPDIGAYEFVKLKNAVKPWPLYL